MSFFLIQEISLDNYVYHRFLLEADMYFKLLVEEKTLSAILHVIHQVNMQYDNVIV